MERGRGREGSIISNLSLTCSFPLRPHLNTRNTCERAIYRCINGASCWLCAGQRQSSTAIEFYWCLYRELRARWSAHAFQLAGTSTSEKLLLGPAFMYNFKGHLKPLTYTTFTNKLKLTLDQCGIDNTVYFCSKMYGMMASDICQLNIWFCKIYKLKFVSLIYSLS